MIALTGATGQLGHYVLQDLLKTVPASQIVAIVRNPAKAQALSQQGVVVRQADYSDEAALTAALQGVNKLLLISSSEVGQHLLGFNMLCGQAQRRGVGVQQAGVGDECHPSGFGGVDDVAVLNGALTDFAGGD